MTDSAAIAALRLLLAGYKMIREQHGDDLCVSGMQLCDQGTEAAVAALAAHDADADLDAPTSATPAEARAMFGAKLEEFARTLGCKAKDLDIPGFACIVMTDAGINVVSGGTHDEWRPMMRRIAGRVSDEMGQVLIAKGVATKTGRG